MDFFKLKAMSPDERREHFARLREHNQKTAPLDPVFAERDYNRAIILANKETYTMKTTISGKADLADIATASLAASKKLEDIRKAYIPARDAILHEHDSTLAALSAQDRLQMQQKLQPSIDAKVKALQAKTAESRAAIIADLKTAKKLADEYAPHLGDARTVASMFGISSAEKQRALAELAEAGPAVVKSAALQAKMMLNDPKTVHEGKILASAVLTRNSAMDKAYRPIKDANAYAAEIFASEVSDIANYEIGIARSLATALAAEREITGEGTSAMQKVILGRQFPGERITPRADIDDEGSNTTPTAKIAAGLAKMRA